MSQKDKAIQRLKSLPKDYTFTEARSLLLSLGYTEDSKGKTSGSRVRFYKNKDDAIDLHKPHPGDEMRGYAVKDLKNHLEQMGEI